MTRKTWSASDAELLDAYVWWNFDIGNMPAQIRVGDQVLSWGESTFIQNGINIINPFDVSKLRVPGAELKEGLVPVGMVSASISPTENLTFRRLLPVRLGKGRNRPDRFLLEHQ